MRHLLSTLFIGLGALALAQDALNLRFNDSGFNYYGGQNGIKTGYIHLDYQDDLLTVRLAAAPSAMPVRFAELVQAINSNGGRTAWNRSAIEARTLIHSFKNGHKDGVTLTHQRAFLGPVMDAYDAALSDLGFVGSVEARYPNVRILNYVNGSGQVQVMFVRLGNTVTVKILES